VVKRKPILLVDESDDSTKAIDVFKWSGIDQDIANKANKNPDNFNVILLTYPKIVDSKSQSTNEGQRFPLTGTIDQAGDPIDC